MRLYDTRYPKPVTLEDHIAYLDAIDFVKKKSKLGEMIQYKDHDSIIIQVHQNGVVCTVLTGMFNIFLTWDELVRNNAFEGENRNGSKLRTM